MLTIESSDENTTASKKDFLKLLEKYAVYRQYSRNHSRAHHESFLMCEYGMHELVLLGDDIIDRLQTTVDFESLLPGTGVFDAGISGDRYEHILYRLMSKQDGGRLMSALEEQDVRVWVVHAGTNNIDCLSGLRDADVLLLRLLLQTLLRISNSSSCIILAGLFYRCDMLDDLVDDANSKLRSLTALMNANLGEDRISFIPAPSTIVKTKHMVDHVNLNEEGYTLWAEKLLPEIEAMLCLATFGRRLEIRPDRRPSIGSLMMLPREQL
ncbi:SGNH hydrolase-type esterase domain-containing protein [Hypoxylon sp. FL0543]|nr:SGNH hydrolase-type esterase domain-containing protein [Hypoxylon sp. FL0543]